MTDLLWLKPKHLKDLQVGDLIVYEWAIGYAIAQMSIGETIIHFSSGESGSNCPVISDSISWLESHCYKFAIIGNIAILAEMEVKLLKKLNLK